MLISLVVFIAELFTWPTIFAALFLFVILLFVSALFLRKGTKDKVKKKKIFIGIGVALFCVACILNIRVMVVNAWTRVDRGPYTFEIRNGLLWDSRKVSDSSYAYGNHFYISEETSKEKRSIIEKEEDISGKMENYSYSFSGNEYSFLYFNVQSGQIGLYPSIRGDSVQKTSLSNDEIHSRDMYFYATDSMIVHMGYLGIPEGQTVPDLQHTFDSIKLK